MELSTKFLYTTKIKLVIIQTIDSYEINTLIIISQRNLRKLKTY